MVLKLQLTLLLSLLLVIEIPAHTVAIRSTVLSVDAAIPRLTEHLVKAAIVTSAKTWPDSLGQLPFFNDETQWGWLSRKVLDVAPAISRDRAAEDLVFICRLCIEEVRREGEKQHD